MTIGTAGNRISFNCNGVSTVFPVTLQAYLNTDFDVWLTTAAGVESLLVLNSDFTLVPSGTLAPTYWTLTTTVIYPTGASLQVIVDPDQVQQTQYVQGEAFPSLAVQTNFDRLTQMVQRLQDQVNRTILAPDGDVNPVMGLPNAKTRASTNLGFDALGNVAISTVLNGSTLSLASLAPYINYLNITQAETATGFTALTLSLQYIFGNVLRYGLVANSAGAAGTNSAILQTLFNPLIASGPTGNFFLPNTTGADVYWFSGVIPCRPGIHIDAQGCTLNYSGTGVAADSDSGLFMAANDFSFVNGTINITFDTGVSTSSGNAFWFGFRESDSPRWPLNPVFDNALAIKQGGIYLHDVRINSTITGANVASSSAISMTGGLTNVNLENIYITGSGTGGMRFGIVYEFGWATSGSVGDTGQSSRQTSHMHDAKFKNINITNMDNVTGAANAFIITGAYGCSFENIYISGCSNGIVCNPGEAQYYRPWAGVDDIGARREMVFKNITIEGASASGITMVGTSTPTAGTYLHIPWVTATNYVAQQTVRNTNNMYVNTGGSGVSSIAPTGTSPTVDGALNWVYVDLTRFTDLLDFSIEGFAISTISTGNAILTYAGSNSIRNGYLTGGGTPLVISEESTRFDVDDVVIHGSNGSGIQADFTASAIWSPPRLKKGVIRNCYIAGNSASAPGTFGGISIKNFDGVIIEGCRFGYESAYSFIQETVQAQAVFISSTTAGANANMLIRGCRVGGAVGGVGFVNNSASVNQGCRVENCTFNAGGTNPVTSPTSGAWLADIESSTAVVIANSNTIASNGLATSRVAPAGAVTGIVLQQGSYQGQKITVINEATAANTITFAAAGTSHVAGGVGVVIAGVAKQIFAWDVSASLWY